MSSANAEVNSAEISLLHAEIAALKSIVAKARDITPVKRPTFLRVANLAKLACLSLARIPRSSGGGYLLSMGEKLKRKFKRLTDIWEILVSEQWLLSDLFPEAEADRPSTPKPKPKPKPSSTAASTPIVEPITDVEKVDTTTAQQIRDIALIWWNEYYPNRLQTLLTQMFGWGQPGDRYRQETITQWLKGESDDVRDRILKLFFYNQLESDDIPCGF